MEIDRETIIEAVGATLPVGALIVAFVLIGGEFSDAQGQLTPAGGQAMIAAFVLFVLLLFAIGLALSWSGDESDAASPDGS